jgi:hypothetical protein
MDVVGITESFEESLQLITTRFGWQSIEYSRYGAAPDESLSFPTPICCRRSKHTVPWIARWSRGRGRTFLQCQASQSGTGRFFERRNSGLNSFD